MSFWHPADEAEAASTMAVFVEWLRATGRLALASPAAVWCWAAQDREAFLAALAGFAGLDAHAGGRANLLRHGGAGEALVLYRGGARRAWSRMQLRAGAFVDGLDSLEFLEVVALAEDCLLAANIRPDQRLLWAGEAGDWRRFGPLVAGATLILVEQEGADPPALAATEAAALFRR